MVVLHKHDGGTGITNFPEEEVSIYERAIKETGDKYLCVGDPIDGLEGLLALHDKLSKRRDLGFFWRIFERIEKEE